MKARNPIKWSELKEFANTLDEDQLSKPVLVMGEERGFDIQSVFTLGEDNYIDDYAMQPISVYDPSDNDNLPLEDSGYEIIPGNTPYLGIDEWEEDPS